MNQAFFNWSGGKDSALALWKTKQNAQCDVKYLLTSMNSPRNRISMHGVRRELLHAQAKTLDIPLMTIELAEEPSMDNYEKELRTKLELLRNLGITQSIFGDIFLEDLRNYREEKLAAAGIDAVFPLWKMDTRKLLEEFILAGFQAVVVCVNSNFLDQSFCGRLLDLNFLADLPPGVDPCGENGEFHSFVYDGPIFSHPVSFSRGEIVAKYYQSPVSPNEKYEFHFCDLLPAE